jgi:formate dehydrogenase subunit gamma
VNTPEGGNGDPPQSGNTAAELRDPNARPVDDTILRFARASRVAHWLLGVPFLLLLLTGLLLFVPEVKGRHVGGYRLVPLIHVVTGIVLIAGFITAYVLQPGRRPLFNDLRRLFRYSLGDAAWMRYAGYSLLGASLSQPATGKFNAGQKLNTYASALFTLGLTVTGIVLGINYFTKSILAATFVEQVYPFHDFFTIVAVPIVAGHLYLSLINPATRPSLRGMLDGHVPRGWARRHHSVWVKEIEDAVGKPGS